MKENDRLKGWGVELSVDHDLTNRSVGGFWPKQIKALVGLISVSKKGSLTQLTYDGYGRQGTDSFEGLRTQVKWSSSAFPSLMLYIGKTHAYKFYNTYS